MAALSENSRRTSDIYNVGCGDSTSLKALAEMIRDILDDLEIESKTSILYRDFRQGDIEHSLADISLAKNEIDYLPTYDIGSGLKDYISSLCYENN